MIVAICDEELLGRVLEEGELRLEVSRDFYGGKRVPISLIHQFISEGTVINLIGNKVVREASKRNKLILDVAIKVGGVLHVQIYK